MVFSVIEFYDGVFVALVPLSSINGNGLDFCFYLELEMPDYVIFIMPVSNSCLSSFYNLGAVGFEPGRASRPSIHCTKQVLSGYLVVSYKQCRLNLAVCWYQKL